MKTFRDMDNKLDTVFEEVYSSIEKERLQEEQRVREEEEAYEREKRAKEALEEEETKREEKEKAQGRSPEGVAENPKIVWKQTEQNLLEKGMILYKDIKDPKEKWRLISELVKTKTMQECIDRFKELRDRALQKKKEEESEEDEEEEEEEDNENGEDEEESDDEDGEDGYSENNDSDDNDNYGEEEEEEEKNNKTNELELEKRFSMDLPIMLVLNEMNMRNFGFGKVSELIITLKCKKCKYVNDLTVKKNEINENYLMNNMVCVNCNVPSSILVRCETFHKDRPLGAKMGTINWDILEVIQADFALTCESCSADNYCKKYVAGSFIGKNCMNCHVITEFSFSSFLYERESIHNSRKNEGRDKDVLDTINKQIENLLKKKKVI